MPDGNGNSDSAGGGGFGGQPTHLMTNMIPTGTGVIEGESPGLGKVAVLLCRHPGVELNIVLTPEDAIREGENLVVMGRKLRSGIVIAGQSDVDSIASSREQTDQMRGD